MQPQPSAEMRPVSYNSTALISYQFTSICWRDWGIGKSPLAICQSSVPDMTPAKLVPSLLVPIKAQWDADVAAGKLSATEESDYLKNAQTKLGFWATNPLGE